MTNIRRALEAAAGVSTGEATPQATDFDGQTTYLERTTQFSNVSDSNTFTLSFWIWPSPMWATATDGGLYQAIHTQGTTSTAMRNNIRYLASSTVSGKVGVAFQDTGSNYFALDIQVPTSTWTNVLVSVNLSSSSTRYVYLNDIDVSTDTDIVTWDTYSNITIDFTLPYSRFGLLHSDQQWFQGRLSNFFLDMTYRDLSSSVNRRHFIDADGFPANPSSLSPPIYFPMTDYSTVGTNSGTGGNMTEYGNFAQSVRGPNQVNCMASDLAAADKMLDASWDATASSVVTASFIYSANARTAETQIIHQPSGGYWDVKQEGSGTTLSLSFGSGAGQATIKVPASNLATYHVALSFNTGSEAASTAWINGVNVTSTATSTTFIGGNINFSGWPKFEMSNNNSVLTVGEVWLEKVYRYLASDNIFWDSDNNRPFTVAQVMENESITPLNALPVYAPNPGQNDGSEINVPTISSLPWRGALSMSEYQGRTIYNQTTDSTKRPIQRYGSALTGVSDGKTWSMAFSCNQDLSSSDKFVLAIGPQYGERLEVTISSTQLAVFGRNSSGGNVLHLEYNATFPVNGTKWYNFLICVDTASSSNCKLYVNGIVQSWTVNTITNADMNLSNATGTCLGGQIESNVLSSAPFKGHYGNVFWTTEYINFGVEANRRKFYSPLQLPVDCGSDGTTPTGTAPAIYMRNDINAYGTNAGTGGDFDTNGANDIIEGRLIGYYPLT